MYLLCFSEVDLNGLILIYIIAVLEGAKFPIKSFLSVLRGILFDRVEIDAESWWFVPQVTRGLNIYGHIQAFISVLNFNFVEASIVIVIAVSVDVDLGAGESVHLFWI